MNKQNKKPVLWRMLLKRVAILAVIFMIVYVVSEDPDVLQSQGSILSLV